MILTKPFEYPILTRHDGVNGKRLYDPGHGRPLPSVTTILSSTADKSFLKEWRDAVGDTEANRVVKESTDLGNQLHLNLENWILYNTKPKGAYLAQVLSNLIIKKGLSKVDEVWGVEAQLYKNDMWAGTTDLVGVHQSEPAIMDFKNSRKIKSREHVEDYFLQLVAYAEAHNEMFNTTIRKGVIMMAVRNGTYSEFVLAGAEWDMYVNKWYDKLYAYYETFGI